MAGRAARKDRDQTPDPAGVSPSLPAWRVSSASIVSCLPTVGPGEGRTRQTRCLLMIDAPHRRRPSAGLVFAIALCLVQFGAFWLAWTPDEPKPGLLIDIGGWLLLSVTAMSGVSLLIFKIDREHRNFTTADLVMVAGFLAPILLFMLAIGFLRPIQ